jgi:hypothetical protein
MQISRALRWLVILVAMLPGCGSSLPASVDGTVTLDGRPLPEGPLIDGTVMFYPTSGGAAAYGSVTSGGKYVMNTGSTKGIEPGGYVVTVRVVEIDPPPPGGYNNAPGQRLITPPRYEDRDQTDLKAEVKAGKNTIDLKLVSS